MSELTNTQCLRETRSWRYCRKKALRAAGVMVGASSMTDHQEIGHGENGLA